ncbi:hypothetical protein B9Y60_10605 [Stenotrophomonas maltophilia]|nr:hypothetical protein B9Y73_10605 [Stenotrophomonas maltophilia]PJL55126.1 hypothetical protein B9Y60_10605 [Stenotrophomonas maltophilia]
MLWGVQLKGFFCCGLCGGFLWLWFGLGNECNQVFKDMSLRVGLWADFQDFLYYLNDGCRFFYLWSLNFFHCWSYRFWLHNFFSQSLLCYLCHFFGLPFEEVESFLGFLCCDLGGSNHCLFGFISENFFFVGCWLWWCWRFPKLGSHRFQFSSS